MNNHITGSKEMGVLLHNWHIGMDAVYGVGSMWFAGRSARLDHQLPQREAQ